MMLKRSKASRTLVSRFKGSVSTVSAWTKMAPPNRRELATTLQADRIRRSIIRSVNLRRNQASIWTTQKGAFLRSFPSSAFLPDKRKTGFPLAVTLRGPVVASDQEKEID